MKPPGSSECLSYDNRLQAVSIDEALHTFPDLSGLPEVALPLILDEENTMRAKFPSQFSLLQKTVIKQIFDITV